MAETKVANRQLLTAPGGVGASVVAARIRRNVNQSIPTGLGFTDLIFDTSATQNNGVFWTSGAIVTIPETGFYVVTTESTFDGAGLLSIATINMQTVATISGVATVIGDDEKQLGMNAKGSLFIYAMRLFTVGDTIVNQVKHSDANSLNIIAQGNHSPDIIIVKINGAKGDAGVGGSTIYVPFVQTTDVIIPANNMSHFVGEYEISGTSMLSLEGNSLINIQ